MANAFQIIIAVAAVGILSAKAGEHRRLVLADESRATLHYYDSENPEACFSIPAEKPLWDLTPVGEQKYRFVVRSGYMVADLQQRKIVETYRNPALEGVSSFCNYRNGEYIASINPGGELHNKAVLVKRFSPNRELTATYIFRGIFYCRTMKYWAERDEILIAHERGFARCRIHKDLAAGTAPDALQEGEFLSNIEILTGRNSFEAVPDRAGKGYWESTGYGTQLAHLTLDGKVISLWRADQSGKKNHFYAQTAEMPNGDIYVANWNGHGVKDSYKGWQVIEFDRDGKVVWHLDDPDKYGSISGICVIE